MPLNIDRETLLEIVMNRHLCVRHIDKVSCCLSSIRALRMIDIASDLGYPDLLVANIGACMGLTLKTLYHE